ncbi:uncharacterized protein CANTADRAFT_67490 [Suhomyces tanzawaensis NRRL Y-17324]|uniref:Actin binding protein n=1 Tax=Suhomyces tanzawaensis NRRL Y-17324 TaxID=984487 RepID=A0A1E4SFZ7_9ASCO|nr:uncharacterized protein CANTADRAFT_67490 [Suhomyces tanzawaensis NRRL Y-17324]ODV78406.1 hypothetical protein CANTADRAFT_67490 [Suhomyces tanzawaensis NRRL Y-17324]
MEKIDLSTNSRAIQDAYDKVVRGDASASYVVYTVDHGTLEVTEVSNGSLDEFVENFTDGQVQFGLARVTVPGSDVSKNLLLGWCPDNSPAKLRLSFATNFAEVSKILSGYHVQITARDQDDLDVDEFLNKVSAAAGARYSIQSGKVNSTAAKPVVSKPAVSKPIVPKPTVSKPTSKPSSFVPKSTGKPIVTVSDKPVNGKQDDDEEWGGEKEIHERDFDKNPLEDVPSAYKPTKVNMAELRKQKSSTISSQPKPNILNQDQLEKNGKSETAKPISERIGAYADDGRITSLPKPKISNSVASRFTPNNETPSSGAPTFGAKPKFGSQSIDNSKDKLVGGASRNFAAQGGKTPAQIWAEKRGQYKSVSPDEDEVANVTEKLKEEEPQEEEEEDQEDKQEEEKPATPVPSLPARNLPPPPVRNVAEPEEKKEAPAPSLPARNLPPPPVRNVAPVAPEPVAEPEPEPVAAPKQSKKSVTAVAEYDYEKDEDNEIGFSEGDLIVDIEFADEEWWSGKHEKTGEVGLFPAAYVVIKEQDSDAKPVSSPATANPTPAAAPASSKGPSAIAEYDYERDEDNEIEFAEGDEIVDIEFVDEDWWSGKHSKSGEVGLFPANYVKLNE